MLYPRPVDCLLTLIKLEIERIFTMRYVVRLISCYLNFFIKSSWTNKNQLDLKVADLFL